MKIKCVNQLKLLKSYKKREQLNKILKIVSINFFKFSICFNVNNRLKKTSKSLIAQRCALTGRSRASKKFMLSRISHKSLIRLGVLEGFKKSVW
jgi:ribosomal protein S14